MVKDNKPPIIINCFAVFPNNIISKTSDRYAKIKYDERQTNVVPSAKFSLLFGLIICQRKGIPKIKIGKAKTPSFLLTSVNHSPIKAKKYKYGMNFMYLLKSFISQNFICSSDLTQ